MQAQEGIENQKLNKLYPSSDGLADCKTTTRDKIVIVIVHLRMSIILFIFVLYK